MDIVTREEWGAKPPRWGPYSMAVPTGELWLHHSAGSGSDATAVRAIQDFHQGPDRNWSDIAYSFLIDDDDDPQVFEGRGAGIVGGHTKDHNSISHAICIIGNFSSKLPKPATIDRLVELVIHGWRQGWWTQPQITGPHRAARLKDGSLPGTECCGDDLVAYIPTINEMIRVRLEEEVMSNVFQRLIETGAAEGVDPAFAADFDRIRALGVFSEHTDPDGVIRAEELGVFFSRLLDRVVVPAIKAAVAEAIGGHAAAANHSGGTLPGTFTARLEVIS